MLDDAARNGLEIAIGVDLGGTKMLVGVLDAEQKVLHREPGALDRPDRRGGAASCSSARCERRRRPARGGRGRARASRRRSTIERGVAITAVNLPIDDLPIRDLIAERLGLPVFVDNDANVAALAEHLYGAAVGAETMVMLTIGTGIGGGLILGGELYRGSDRRRRRARPHRDRRSTARPARATARTTAASRRSPRAPRSVARAAPRPSASPTRRSAAPPRRARRSTARR